MNKLYHERLDAELKPELKKSNEIALEFEGIKSRIDIDTARNKGAGRSHTYQIVHKSESSRFQFPKDVNLGIANAVADLPGTMVFDESTANGMNFWYDDVERSRKCEDGYDFVFVAWYENPDYSMPVYGMDFVRTPEEIELAQKVEKDFKYTLTDAQLNWRRFTIVHKCGGDLNLFRQEYPSYPEEAFIFSGRPRFDVNILRELKSHAKDKISANGLLNIYRPLDSTSKYIIGVDTSEGLANGDNSSVSVLDCQRYSVAAHYQGKIAPDVLAAYLKTWGMYYNEALIVVESNNHGLVTINYLKDIYLKLYTRKVYDKITDEWTEKIGFQTNAKTKPLLISNLDKGLRSGLDVPVSEIISELMTYVIEDDGATNAAEGKKDDNVISLALAVQGYVETSEFTIPKEKEQPKENTPGFILERLKKEMEARKNPMYAYQRTAA